MHKSKNPKKQKMKICIITIQIQTSPNMSNAKRTTTKISNRFTELIDVTTMEHAKLYFETPQELEIQQGNKTIKYYKIPIGYQQKGGVGECVISIPMFCHCFGIEEFQNESGKVTAHGAGLSMIDNNASAEEQQQQLQFVKSFVSMVEIIKKHLFSVKKEVKKPTLDASDLKGLCPMRQSIDEEGNPKGNAWFFSPKLMERKIYNKDDPSDVQMKMETVFYAEDQLDEHGEPVEISPLEFVGKKHFKFRGSVKIESIYIGSKISLQCKIYDGAVRTVNQQRKRLTSLPAAVSSLLDEDE